MNTSRSLDFPIWMPSALVKELRQGLRTPSFILLVSIVPSLLSFFFLFSFIINPLDGEPFISPDGCQIIFWVTMVVALLFIMPLRASTSIGTNCSPETTNCCYSPGRAQAASCWENGYPSWPNPC